jgi:hypothetical protein
MKTIHFLALIVFIHLSICVDAQEKFFMEYKYKSGANYKYSQESKYNSTQEFNGQEMKANGSNLVVVNLFVEKVLPDSSIQFLSTLVSAKTMMKMAMMDTVVEFKDVDYKGVRSVISKKGQLISKEVLDTLKTGNSFLDQNASFSSGIFKELESMPKEPILIGEKWQVNRTDTVPESSMVTVVHAENTLVGFETKNGRQCMRINTAGKMDITGKMSRMGAEFFIEGTGDVVGSYWFDPKEGLIVAKESKTEQEMTLVLTGQMQMTIPVTQQYFNTFFLVE